MEDPIELLGDERMREIATDLYVQLEKGTAMRPVLWMLVQSRKRAAVAIGLIVDVDPTDAEAIRKIQAEIRLYDDQITACRALFERGRQADARITEHERQVIDELVISMTPEERRAHGLQPRSED